MKNTRITLTYTSGNLDKTDKEVIVRGEISRAQIERIKDNLIDGEFIIAHEVGLPTPSENFYGFNDYPSKEYDHVRTRMIDFIGEDCDIESLLTDEPESMNITIEELSHKIANAEWDDEAEMARMGLDEDGNLEESCDTDKDDEKGLNTRLKLGYFNTEGKKIINEVILKGELDQSDIQDIFESSRAGIIVADMVLLVSPSDSIEDDPLFPNPYVDNPFTVLVDFFEKDEEQLQFEDIFCENPKHIVPNAEHFHTTLEPNVEVEAKYFVFAIGKMVEEIVNYDGYESEWNRMEEKHFRGPEAEKERLEKIEVKHRDLIESIRKKQDVLMKANAKDNDDNTYPDLVF